MHGDSAVAGGRNVPPALPWRMSKGWWLKNSHYFMYMMRELSAVFAALWVVLFLVQLPSMAAGPDKMATFSAWLDFVRSPGWVVFSLISLVFVFYHALTWIKLMGTVIRVRVGTTVITGNLVVGLVMLVWAGVSIVVGFIISTPAIGG